VLPLGQRGESRKCFITVKLKLDFDHDR
jgi:hypothetical protein